MKTYQPYLFALWVTLCLAACNNEDNVLSTPDEYSATLWAGIDKDADARIALGQSEAGATKLYWTADDAFALVNGNNRYTFTRSDNGTAPVADASFTYSGSKQLPAINTSGLKFIYPAKPVSGYATQTGKEEDLSQCLGMEAAMPNGATSYNDLSLRFTHTTAVVKMALTHNRFKGQDVSIKFFAQGLLPDGNLITTGKLKGDSNGAVTAYIVIPVTGKALTNCRIYATAGGKTYETSLGNKTVASGKLYEITKSDLVESTQLIACKLPSGSEFNNILENIIGNSTKIKFIANSNEGTAISDIPGAAYRINGEWLEIHTPLLEFLFNEKSSFMFNGLSFTQLQKVVTIDFNNCINTSLVTDMRSMFYRCSSLTSLNVNNFNTEKVTNMWEMFSDCSSLTSLDLSNFKTEQVTDMSFMFRDCSSLTSLDVSKFNTEQVTKMNFMFRGCSSLTSLNVSNFKTEKVTGMNGMFDNCSSLTSLNVSNFKTEKVTDMSFMFCLCASLTSLDLSNFNTEKVTDMENMFSGCKKLTSLDLSNFNTEQVTDMSWMFSSCASLTSLDVSNFNTEKVTDMENMFSSCKKLTSLDLSNFNTEQVTDMSGMFDSCSSLTSLKVSNFNTSNVTNMYRMFYQCSSLTSLDVSNFNTEEVTDMWAMFGNCSTLTSLNVSNFKTEKVTVMKSMFGGCSSLTSLHVSNFKTEKVTDMSWMFSGCSSLTSLDVSNFNTEKVTGMEHMFSVCSSLTSLDIRNFNVSNVTKFSDMFLNLGYKSSGKTPIYVTSALKNILVTKSTGLKAEDAEYKLVD